MKKLLFVLAWYVAPLYGISTDIGPVSVYVQGRYVYVVNATDSTLQIFDANNHSAPLLVSDTATDTTPSYVCVQGHLIYVINNGSSTLQIFNASNPTSPTLVGTTATSAAPTAAFIQGRYLYITNTTTPVLEIFDVGDPTNPLSVGSIATDADPRAVYIKGAYAYVVCGSSSMFDIFDVSDPTNPSSAGSITTGIGTTPTALYVQNGYAFLTNTGSSDLLQAFNINDPTSPSFAGSIITDANPQAVYVQGSIAYVAIGSDNMVQFFDVSDPTSISGVDSTSTDADPISLVIQGKFLYVVNFSANTLQIIDLTSVYVQQFEAGGAEIGTLHARGNTTINNNLDVNGSGTFGRGLHATGNSSMYGTTQITGAASSPALTITAGAADLVSAPKLLNLLVAASVENLQINGSTGELFRPSSTKKVKENFRPIDPLSSGIYHLNPVMFDFKSEHGGAKNQLGFIAEEVAQAFPTAVNYEADGSPRSIKYDCLHAPTIKELQNHQKKLNHHEDIIAVLIKKIEALQALLTAQLTQRSG